MLFIYLAHATFFYFLKNLSLQTGAGNVGVFFTVSMIAMIAVRLFGAAVLDRLNKRRLLLTVLVLLMFCLTALPNVATPSFYYGLAIIYGGSMGIALPVINALIFSASAPSMRGFNTNISLFAMDAGYFITPYLGGMLIALGADFSLLFYAAAGFTMVCLALIAVSDGSSKGEYNNG
jgi:MFS family permease